MHVKDTVMLLYKLDNARDGAFVKMFNMVLWIYFGVWICQGSEFDWDTQGSEYAWVYSWIMLEYF